MIHTIHVYAVMDQSSMSTPQKGTVTTLDTYTSYHGSKDSSKMSPMKTIYLI